MSKIIRTRKPSVLPFYAMALVFLVLCAVLPVYKLWALLAALGGAFVAFGAAQKVCPPRVAVKAPTMPIPGKLSGFSPAPTCCLPIRMPLKQSGHILTTWIRLRI